MSEDPAKARFFVIQTMRWSGLALVIVGLMIILGKIDVVKEAGYAIFLVGLADALIMPSVLSRLWKTPLP